MALKIRVQSVESGLFLTRSGRWTKETSFLCTDPVEALRLCMRLGIKDVRFILSTGKRDEPVYFYPFGGDPAHKACRKELRKRLAEQRRARTAHRVLAAKIKTLEARERCAG